MGLTPICLCLIPRKKKPLCDQPQELFEHHLYHQFPVWNLLPPIDQTQLAPEDQIPYNTSKGPHEIFS
jgi:hypothetical protein